MSTNGLDFITSTTYTSSSTINVDGCFTSTYDRYLILGDMTTATNGGVAMRLRASGSDNTATQYQRQVIFASSTTVAGERSTSQNQFNAFSVNTTGRNFVAITIDSPALARTTTLISMNYRSDSNAVLLMYANAHTVSSAFDGFSWSGLSLTGKLSVYGYVKS